MADGQMPEDLRAEAFEKYQRERVAQLRLTDEAPTESRVARLFVEAHQGLIAYSPEQGRWYTRKDKHSALWTMDAIDHVGTLIDEHIGKLSEHYDPKQARAMQRAAFSNGARALASRDRRLIVQVRSMDAQGDVLGTPGGVFDLRRARRVDDFDGFLTKYTACAPSFEEPALYLQLLEDWQKSAELRELIWRLAGYWATGSTSEQMAVIAHGPAGTGKSTAFNPILSVLGDYGIVAPHELFLTTGLREHPTMIASLRGARLALVHELPAGARFNESLFKSVVGGDPQAARYMRSDFFMFRPCVKLLFVTNHLPGMTAHESMRRRIRVVPFTRMVSRATLEKGLQHRLAEEAPQILGWILRGAQAWYAGGLPDARAVDDASEAYFDEADAIGSWIEECTDLGKDEDENELWDSTKDLYRAWTHWCRENGERAGTKKSFSQRLAERGYARERNKAHTAWGFYGVRLKPDVRAALENARLRQERQELLG